MFEGLRFWLKQRQHRKMMDSFMKDMRDSRVESMTKGGTTLMKHFDGSGRMVMDGGHCDQCNHFPCDHAYQRKNKEGIWEWIHR